MNTLVPALCFPGRHMGRTAPSMNPNQLASGLPCLVIARVILEGKQG